MNALAKIEPAQNVEAYRASTDAAAICKDIVVATATTIQGRKYVNVEGWQAIAIAHGCAAGARDVEKVDGGVRAIGEIRRMSDGVVISVAEGFVGEDEETWYGGTNKWGKTLPKRADYAIRAMAQTRAISRACRSAFAHVVVMMNAGLATVPAEEVPLGGFDNEPARQPEPVREQQVEQPAPARAKPAPLTGKHKNRAAARVAYGEIVRELHGCGDEDQLAAYLDTIKEDIAQFETELPAAWNGDGADFIGLKAEIDNARIRVANDTPAPIFAAG